MAIPRARTDLARLGAWSAAIGHAPRVLGGAAVTNRRAQLIKEIFWMGVTLTPAATMAASDSAETVGAAAFAPFATAFPALFTAFPRSNPAPCCACNGLSIVVTNSCLVPHTFIRTATVGPASFNLLKRRHVPVRIMGLDFTIFLFIPRQKKTTRPVTKR